jgi:MFS transporter, PHS family, inorganic phosphate transporter
MMAAVFSMQGVGQLLAAIVALVVTAASKNIFINVKDVASCDGACLVACDRAWRIIIGFGALPACFALYYRITIPETPRYTFDVAQDIEQADADIKAYMQNKGDGYVDPLVRARAKKVSSPALTVPSASWPDVSSYFKKWRNLKILIGTTLSWFFLVCRCLHTAVFVRCHAGLTGQRTSRSMALDLIHPLYSRPLDTPTDRRFTTHCTTMRSA